MSEHASKSALANCAASRVDMDLARAACDPSAQADAQIAEIVREQIHQRGGRALEGVQVTCRHGVVRLSGRVANEELHRLAVRIADHDLDLETIDDIFVAPFPKRAHVHDFEI
jgi:osmotically-inducible protein OsmY